MNTNRGIYDDDNNNNDDGTSRNALDSNLGSLSQENSPGNIFGTILYSGRIHIVGAPKKLIQWVYSFSLFLLIILMLAFASVTPIDVIVQTSGQSSSAIKMFIVIVGYVLFLLISLSMYLSRIYHGKVALNDIPTRSVYIPSIGDIPKTVVKRIEKELQRCLDIKMTAGPLNYSEPISHDGLSPPAYVQDRNGDGIGTFFPPDSYYEDVIRSIGDKFASNSKFISEIDLPKQYSTKELIFTLAKMHLKKSKFSVDQITSILRAAELYEKFKFGPDLIKEVELLEFMNSFEKLGPAFQTELETNFITERDRHINTISDNLDRSIREASSPHLPYYKSDMYDDTDTSYHVKWNRKFSKSDSTSNYLDQESNVQDPVTHTPTNNPSVSTDEESLAWIASSYGWPSNKNGSNPSFTGTIIKHKLALSSTYSDMGDSVRRYSGYVSDSENESKSDSHIKGPILRSKHRADSSDSSISDSYSNST